MLFETVQLLDNGSFPNWLNVKSNQSGGKLTMGLILLIVLLVLVFGGLPRWGYHSYGYGPSGIVGVILIIVLILFLMGRL